MIETDHLTIDISLFEFITVDRCYQLSVWPIRQEDDTLVFATAVSENWLLPAQLRALTGRNIALKLVDPILLESAVKVVEAAENALKSASQTFKHHNDESLVPLEESDPKDDGPVARLINTLLMNAVQKRASDIHLEAYEKGVQARYRIDGVLYPAVDALDRRYLAMLVSRIKILADMDIAEKRLPQDGRFRYTEGGKSIDCRVSTLPSVHGEDVVIRILDKENITNTLQRLSLDILGMDDQVLQKLRRSVHEPYGMILVTGPTGSGKTTTLYAAVSELNVREEKIITVEDPVEYQLDGVIQIPVNEKKGLTFAKGLRSILRHDPDKIMIGEIRDLDTAQIAVQAALTGHLVFSTVHANNVFDVVGRFRHMGLSVYDFVSSLNCIMAQRLVRNLCVHCKVSTSIPESELTASGIDLAKYSGDTFFAPVGCDKCGYTGYNGRSAIVEFLDLSPDLKDMLIEQRSLTQIHRHACENGFRSLRDAAVAKFVSGGTSLKEINRVTFVE